MENSSSVSWPTWPQYGPREIDAAARVVQSRQLFAANEVRAFERDFASYTGSNHAVGVGNATQGLHLALAALDVGQGDEVIVTACSWISSASCILMQNAVPVFADIESESLGLDPKAVEEAITEHTKAIVLVHILGYPALVNQVLDVANRYGIPLVEDASHAPGAAVNGKRTGSFGSLGVFSLHQRKAISTGDGGVIVTDDPELAERLWRLRSFGADELSYNYRMTEIAGALGRLGLEKLDSENAERRNAAEYLAEALSDHEWLTIRLVRPHETGAYYAVAIEVDLSDDEATHFVESMSKMGFPIRKVFAPLNRHPHFNPRTPPARGIPWQHPDYAGKMRDVDYSLLDLPVTYAYCQGRVLELYTHPGITQEHLDQFVAMAESTRRELSTGRGVLYRG